jgi:hypothetical protein
VLGAWAVTALACARAFAEVPSSMSAGPATTSARDAQPAPAPTTESAQLAVLPGPGPTEETPRFTLEPHTGLALRVGASAPNQSTLGGAILGLDALLALNQWYGAGIGVEHAWRGADRSILGADVLDVVRVTDTLLGLGRYYPWQNEAVALFAQLGAGPAWQTMLVSPTYGVGPGMHGKPGAPPSLTASASSGCTAHASASLGLQVGLGIEARLGELVLFSGELSLDHAVFQDEVFNGCASGMGPSTFVSTWVGLALATGRGRPPPRPPPPVLPQDRDADAVTDPVDACPDQPGTPSLDPTKNGCPQTPDTPKVPWPSEPR